MRIRVLWCLIRIAELNASRVVRAAGPLMMFADTIPTKGAPSRSRRDGAAKLYAFVLPTRREPRRVGAASCRRKAPLLAKNARNGAPGKVRCHRGLWIFSGAQLRNGSLIEGEAMRKTASFLFVVLNGTWALMAYMLHVVGVRPAVIATVAAIGLLLGNLALYSGVHLAKKLLRKKTGGPGF